VRATLRSGPIGTGGFLLGSHLSWTETQEVEVWLLLSFLPLVPVSRWRVSCASIGGEAGAEALEVTVHSKGRISVSQVLGRLAKALGVAILTIAPFAFSVWRLGWPWASPLLTGAFGGVVGPGILARLGMAIEMAVTLGGAALPILVCMHLDESTPRIPLTFLLRRHK
jgi:hypothetical protein